MVTTTTHMPTIAHVSFSGDFGGREKVAASLFKGMENAGYDCRLYMIVEERHGPDRNWNLLKALGDMGSGCRYFRTDNRFSWKLLLELRKALKSDRIGIIHCHCYKSLFYVHLLRTIGMLHGAVFYTLHGLVLRPGWNSSLIKITQSAGLRLCDGVIGCSREILESALSKDWKRKKAVIINAIESRWESFDEVRVLKSEARKRLVEKYDLNPGQPIVINVGRLCPQKNFSLYLRMIETFMDRDNAGAEANFLILGNGEMEKELKEEAAMRGVAGKVVFTGFVADMPEVFSGADLLVQTSIWEGTPMCLLEAQSFGLPAVVPAVGGNIDVVKDGLDGLLYPVNDLDALYKKTISYLTDAQLRLQHGETAFDVVKREFNIGTWIHQHIDFYSEVID